VFTETQADHFIQLPQAEEAIRLRRWDDCAKDPAAVTPDLDYYTEIARQLLIEIP
jgi:predicted HD phosphohydrolase